MHIMSISERRACRALGQHRSTQRKAPRGRGDEEALTADLIELARRYGRYGYRKITALLRNAGWLVNDKRVERIWRREGLKVPAKQPKRGRLWLADGSCIRLRPRAPATMCGPTTSSRIAPTMAGSSACSASLTSSRTSAWPSGWNASSRRSTSSMCSRTSSSCGACLATSAPIMAPSSWPRRCSSGSRRSGPRPPTSLRAHRGRTGMWSRFNARLRDELLDGEIFYTIAGSADHHRELETTLQHGAHAWLNRLPAAGTRGVRACLRRMAGYAHPTSSAGHATGGEATNPELTSEPDHSMGADQVRRTRRASARRTRSHGGGPGGERGPRHHTISARPRPTSSAPSARARARELPWSCRPATPKP